MNILLVTTGLGMGGAERQVSDLASRLVMRGHKVGIAYMVGDVIMAPKSAEVEMFPLKCSKTPWGLCLGAYRLHAIVRQFKPDVVHSHMVHANIFTRLTRLFVPMPKLISTAHNVFEGGRIVDVAYRLTDRLATISTNVSQEAVTAFEEKGAVIPGRMIPVLNGIDLQVFGASAEQRADSRARLYAASGRQLLLSVGRLVPEKNHRALLGVFAQLVKHRSDVDLWIAGDGPLHDVLKQDIQRLGLSKFVRLLGARFDVPDLMRAADVVVLPSLFEGFGLVVAEAMASGATVVATDAGGVAEVMQGHGFLLPVNDDVALFNALNSALSLDANTREQKVNAAQAHVYKSFNIERTVDRWLQIYQGLGQC